MGQKTLQLGAEEEGISHLGVVEGLNAEGVPGTVELLLLLVPDDKGEHAPQTLGKLRAKLLVALEDDLGVRVGEERTPGGDELLPKLLEIVDLAVIGQDQLPVLADHRLVSIGKVDDGKTAVGDGAVLVHKKSLVVGTAVADFIRHGLQGPLVRNGAGNKTGNAAHKRNLQLLNTKIHDIV